MSALAQTLAAAAWVIGTLGACVEDDPGSNSRPDVVEPPDAGLDARPEAGPSDAGPDATPDAWVWVTAPCDATFIELPPSGETRNQFVNNWDRYVVYDDGRFTGGNTNQDIYLYDLQTCTEYPLAIAPGIQVGPAIWKSEVAWADYQDGTTFDDDLIMGFDIDSATADVLTPPGLFWGVAFNERYLVALSNEGEVDPSYAHAVLIDRWTADETLLGESWQGAEHFSMSETHLAWIMSCTGCGGVSDVFYLDLSTKDIVHIEDTIAGNQLRPSTWGDYILWQDDREGGTWKIFAHRISTGETWKLVDDPMTGSGPYLRGNLATWYSCYYASDCTYVGGDIILFDIDTAVFRRVTTESAYYRARYAHGDWLVYLLSMGGDYYKMYGVHMQAAGLVDQDGHVIPE
jgi:hypothetical protein